MREIDKVLKLSELTDFIIEMVQAEKLSPNGASLMINAIESDQITFHENGELLLPIEFIKWGIL